jgi:hypothetical protein
MVSSLHRLYWAIAVIAGISSSSVWAEDAALKRFEANLTASSSATQFLTDKCASLKLASPPVILAVRERAVALTAGPDVRRLLDVGADSRLGYRRVKLSCGTYVLSEADNWYVPARLTQAMNQTLDTTEVPFGAVVKPLNFHRKTLKMEALEDGAHALRVTAVLVAGDGEPFSVVVENYSNELVTGDRP